MFRSKKMQDGKPEIFSGFLRFSRFSKINQAPTFVLTMYKKREPFLVNNTKSMTFALFYYLLAGNGDD